jgi:hypothetical protein
MNKFFYIFLIMGIFAITACASTNNNGHKADAFTPREQIVEVVNKLFVYTDEQNWDKLRSEVFDDAVLVDMVSVGAEKAEIMTAQEICDMWKEGFKGLDAIHHQSGDYLITIEGNNAVVTAYAIASHYKKAAMQGNVRQFIGSYDLKLIKKENGWRLNQFKYNLKYMDGNLELK